MPFTVLVLLSAFLIESIGTYVSVLGLASLFSANPIIIAMAVALDIGKVVSVSFLYKKWKQINLIMKSYMTIASIVLMIITSAGVFGFLSGEFQKAISGTSSQTVMIKTLEEEQARLQKRKEEIDKQIAQLPENMVRGRTQLMRQFAPEVNRINDRLAEIDKELPQLKIDSIKKNVEVGPIMYVAEAFNTTPEQAVKWVILVIIFVFDPLAIALLLAGNFLLEERRSNKNKQPSDEPKLEEIESPKKDQEAVTFPVVEDTPVKQPIAEPIPEPEVKQPEQTPVVEQIKEENPVIPTTEIIIDESSTYRSSLEDLTIKGKVDVEVDNESRPNISQLKNIYKDTI
jgi:hypothetical protein